MADKPSRGIAARQSKLEGAHEELAQELANYEDASFKELERLGGQIEEVSTAVSALRRRLLAIERWRDSFKRT